RACPRRGRGRQALAAARKPDRAPHRRAETRRQHRSGGNRVGAPGGRLRRRRVPDGLPEDQRPLLEEGAGPGRRRALGRGPPKRRPRRRALGSAQIGGFGDRGVAAGAQPATKLTPLPRRALQVGPFFATVKAEKPCPGAVTMRYARAWTLALAVCGAASFA